VPQTPDSFVGTRLEDAICFYDQYGIMPTCLGGLLYTDGYFYAKDQYGIFNLRHPSSLPPKIHVNTHLGSGSDTFYVLSPNIPGINEDINDGYHIGFRWINTVDDYEYVLLDNTAGAAVWKGTTGVAVAGPHAITHIEGGTDQIDGDKLNIDYSPICYSPDISPPEVTSTKELTAHLAGIDDYVCFLGNQDAYLQNEIKHLNSDIVGLDNYFVTPKEHRYLHHLIHFIDEGPALEFASGAYKEMLPIGNPFPTSEIWWVSSAKLKKIVELTITRDSSKKPTIEVWKMYDIDGTTVVETITDTISYSGTFEINRMRTIA
jgi:hypothetical protein